MFFKKGFYPRWTQRTSAGGPRSLGIPRRDPKGRGSWSINKHLFEIGFARISPTILLCSGVVGPCPLWMGFGRRDARPISLLKAPLDYPTHGESPSLPLTPNPTLAGRKWNQVAGVIFGKKSRKMTVGPQRKNGGGAQVLGGPTSLPWWTPIQGPGGDISQAGFLPD